MIRSVRCLPRFFCLLRDKIQKTNTTAFPKTSKQCHPATKQALGFTLGNDPTSDDTSGVSSAPIDTLLFEARLNGAGKPCGYTMWYKSHCLIRSHRRRGVGVQPTSSNVAGFRLQNRSPPTARHPCLRPKHPASVEATTGELRNARVALLPSPQ